VLPLPSLPWQEAQSLLQFAAASAATLIPAEAMIIVANTNNFRFMRLMPFLVISDLKTAFGVNIEKLDFGANQHPRSA
jgi:hypothetical protein